MSNTDGNGAKCILDDLKNLADEWEWEVETYIESVAPNERTMAVQKYQDLCELNRIIEEYDDDQ